MIAWTVEPSAGGGWSVVRTVDGRREEPRARLTGLSCITARVLAAELRAAYDLGRGVFAEGLGD